jgi:nickel transport protein
MMRRAFVVFCFLLPGAPAFAHEVHHAVESVGAVAVRLNYADGKPFVFEAFEAYPDDKDVPTQVGRTDNQGRAVFVPGTVRHWRVKAFTTDGHGIDLRFDAPAMTAFQNAATLAPSDVPNRASLLVFGFSLLLGGFGIYQLWLRNRK